MLFLKEKIETVYLLENPQRNIIKYATGTQLRYEDIIKEVFGVTCIDDLKMMIQYNKSFQESICDRNGISENKITLNRILRVASRMDLLELRKQLIDKKRLDIDASLETDISLTCPFDYVIKLQEGIFSWNEGDSSYYSV